MFLLIVYNCHLVCKIFKMVILYVKLAWQHVRRGVKKCKHSRDITTGLASIPRLVDPGYIAQGNNFKK